MHPQAAELRALLAALLDGAHESIIVHHPDRLIYVDVLGPDNAGGDAEMTIDVPRDFKDKKPAKRAGFKLTSRTIYHPFTRESAKVPYLRAAFGDPDAGVRLCFAALQDVFGIGQDWLWITSEPYDEWPQPLPRPEPWPPA